MENSPLKILLISADENFARGVSKLLRPAADEVEVSVQSAKADDAMVEFVNPLGSMVYSTTKHLASGENLIRIATREFAGGVYYLRLRTAGGVCGQSVVIEH